MINKNLEKIHDIEKYLDAELLPISFQYTLIISNPDSEQYIRITSMARLAALILLIDNLDKEIQDIIATGYRKNIIAKVEDELMALKSQINKFANSIIEALADGIE